MAKKRKAPSSSHHEQSLEATQSQTSTRQHQPKIKSFENRERIYVASSGLLPPNKNNTSLRKKVPQLKPEQDLMNGDADSPESKFGKKLGSTDPKVRHFAVQRLKEYLKARTDIIDQTTEGEVNDGGSGKLAQSGGLSEMDLMKLWKALWYTLYMSDKVPVQYELSKQLTELIWCVAGTEQEDMYASEEYLANDILEDDQDEEIGEKGDNDEESSGDESYEVEMQVIHDTLSTVDRSDGNEADDNDTEEKSNEEDPILIRHCRGVHLVSLVIKTFFRTVNREWGNIDYHRIDKFYVVIRKMMFNLYSYCAKRKWNEGIIRIFNDVLWEEVLTKYPNGLRLHVVDVALEELARAASSVEGAEALSHEEFITCMEPFFVLLQKEKDAVLQKRVLENIARKFLMDFSVVGEKALEVAASSSDHSDNALNGTKDTDEDSEVDDEEYLIMEHVHVQTIADFLFEIARDHECMDRYRKSLYDMHKTYIKCIKTAGFDVDIEEMEGSDNEVDLDDVNIDELENENEGVIIGHKTIETSINAIKEEKKKTKMDIDERDVNTDGKKDDQNVGKLASDEIAPKKIEKAKKQKKKDSKKENKSKKKSEKSSTDILEINVKQTKVEVDTASSSMVSAEQVTTSKNSTPSEMVSLKFAVNKVVETESNEKKSEDNVDVSLSSSKKKKKKKKKKKAEKSKEEEKDNESKGVSSKDHSSSEDDKKEKKKDDDRDEDIVISTQDQKKAIYAAVVAAAASVDEKELKFQPSTPKMKKRRVSRPASSPNSGSDERDDGYEQKHVKFGSTNRSKSHKASMKDLKTISHPFTPCRTPDKSIVLKAKYSTPNKTPKGETHRSSVKKSKSARKKAKDYL